MAAAWKATEGIRTLDLAFTKRLLCQLSYGGGGSAWMIIQGLTMFCKES